MNTNMLEKTLDRTRRRYEAALRRLKATAQAFPEEVRVLAHNWQAFRDLCGTMPAEHLLVDKACFLNLSAPELSVLVAGLRAMNANYDGSDLGVLTDKPGALTTDYFTNLLDMGTVWEPIDDTEDTFAGRDRNSGAQKWTASRADLVFGSNSQLRAVAEVYASAGNAEKFVKDFVAAWTKVRELDRFDLNH